MFLAFYNGPGSLITHIIRLVTLGKYSHVELVFSDEMHFESDSKYGVRFVKKECSRKDWIFFDLAITQEQELKLRKYCQLFDGKKYNWLGVLSFLFPFLNRRNGDTWYCVELILTVLQDSLGWFINLDRHITPNEFFEYVDSISKPKHK